MTAEKIISSNALASLTRGKTQELPAKQNNSADIFSKHLDHKLENVNKNSAPIERTDRSERSNQADNHRKNEFNANKISDEKQKSTSRQEALHDKKQIEKDQQADKRLEEKRADEANEKRELSEKQTAKSQNSDENTELFSSDDQSLTGEETNNNETANADTNQAQTTDSSETTNNAETESQNTIETTNNNEDLEVLTDGNGETTNEAEIATAETTATLSAAQENSIKQTNADQKGLVTNSPALSNQQDGQAPTGKSGQPIDGSAAKTQPHLESTLGQDNEGQANGDGQKGQSSENQTPFSKSKPDLFTPKDGTFSQTNQAQANNSPILGSTQIADQLAKGQNLKATSPEITQLISNEKPGETTATSIGTNGDVKQSTPATQLRAAGYTSPTQSVAIQIAAKAQNGAQQFEIRLNPPELGRVDVRLEFTKDGQVTTHLIVERPETLDMLSKDARQLEKALSEAGVDIENEGLTFSLQDQESRGSNPQDQNNQFTNDNQFENDETATPIEPETIYRQLTATSGLDMSV